MASGLENQTAPRSEPQPSASSLDVLHEGQRFRCNTKRGTLSGRESRKMSIRTQARYDIDGMPFDVVSVVLLATSAARTGSTVTFVAM